MIRLYWFELPGPPPRPFSLSEAVREAVRETFGPSAAVERRGSRPVLVWTREAPKAAAQNGPGEFPADRGARTEREGPAAGAGTDVSGYLSIAHSGTAAVCALSDAPVGVDLERADRLTGTLVRSFTPEERLFCERKTGGSPPPELLIFTRKEAVMKATDSCSFSAYRRTETVRDGNLCEKIAGLPVRTLLREGWVLSIAGTGVLQFVEKKIFSDSGKIREKLT